MSYISTTDTGFLATLEEWLRRQREILLLIRYHAGAGAKDFEFSSSFDALAERLRGLPPRASVIAFKQPQLPFRGIVDDDLVAKCLSSIPDGSEYLVLETKPRMCGERSFCHWSAGESHTELREELEDLRGSSVAVGLYPSWLEDTEDVISAYVPDEDGVVRPGGLRLMSKTLACARFIRHGLAASRYAQVQLRSTGLWVIS